MTQEQIRIVHFCDIRAGSWAGETPVARADRVARVIREQVMRDTYKKEYIFDYFIITGNSTTGFADRRKSELEIAGAFIRKAAELLLTNDKDRAKRVLITPGMDDIGAPGEPDRFAMFNQFTVDVQKALGDEPPVDTGPSDPTKWYRLRVMKELTLLGLHIELPEQDPDARLGTLGALLDEIVRNHPMPSTAYTRAHRPVVMACDQYPEVLLDGRTAVDSRAIGQRFRGLGEQLFLCFNEGPLQVIPPQPLRPVEFYAFGRHRGQGGGTGDLGISLLQVQIDAAQVTLGYTRTGPAGHGAVNARDYRIAKAIPCPNEADLLAGVLGPHLQLLGRLIEQKRYQGVVVVRGIPGSGHRELHKFLINEAHANLPFSDGVRQCQVISHRLPGTADEANRVVGELCTIARKNFRSMNPILILLSDPNILPRYARDLEGWQEAVLAGCDLLTREPSVSVVYFPHEKNTLPRASRYDIENLIIRPLDSKTHEVSVRGYESKLPMAGAGHLRALTGGFTGFDLALCRFALHQFENHPPTTPLSPELGLRLFNAALGPIPTLGASQKLKELLAEFEEWLEPQPSGRDLLAAIRDQLEEGLVCDRIRSGQYDPVAVKIDDGTAGQTLVNLREAMVFDTANQVQLMIPFLRPDLDGYGFRFHLACPGAQLPKAKQLRDELVSKRNCKVYLYSEPDSQDPGQPWPEKERESIREVDGFILVYDAATKAGEMGSFLHQECKFAEDVNKPRIVVLLGGVKEDIPPPAKFWTSASYESPWPTRAANRVMRIFRDKGRGKAGSGEIA